MFGRQKKKQQVEQQSQVTPTSQVNFAEELQKMKFEIKYELYFDILTEVKRMAMSGELGAIQGNAQPVQPVQPQQPVQSAPQEQPMQAMQSQPVQSDIRMPQQVQENAPVEFQDTIVEDVRPQVQDIKEVMETGKVMDDAPLDLSEKELMHDIAITESESGVTIVDDNFTTMNESDEMHFNTNQEPTTSFLGNSEPEIPVTQPVPDNAPVHKRIDIKGYLDKIIKPQLKNQTLYLELCSLLDTPDVNGETLTGILSMANDINPSWWSLVEGTIAVVLSMWDEIYTGNLKDAMHHVMTPETADRFLNDTHDSLLVGAFVQSIGCVLDNVNPGVTGYRIMSTLRISNSYMRESIALCCLGINGYDIDASGKLVMNNNEYPRWEVKNCGPLIPFIVCMARKAAMQDDTHDNKYYNFIVDEFSNNINSQFVMRVHTIDSGDNMKQAQDHIMGLEYVGSEEHLTIYLTDYTNKPQRQVML